MDEEERSSGSSGESERDNEADEALDEGDEGNGGDGADGGNGGDEGDEEEEEEEEGEGDERRDATDKDKDKDDDTAKDAAADAWRPRVRPEALAARLYDIVPTMAAPMATSINALAVTPDLRYWITGGSDGYIRKYDGPGTINGKLALTVAQRHPFVDSVTKAGMLMSYWENEEPSPRDQEHVLSPVYSLAVHSAALWLLSGLESGGINLQSVRHDEGKKICCLQRHSNAVSVLTLAPDERSVLSGGWDKNLFDWDLGTGAIRRSFDGSGGQISSIELRPASGAPVPPDADDPLPPASSTMATNNGAPPANGVEHDGGGGGGGDAGVAGLDGGPGPGGGASPAHESLFGGSDASSLFGETAGEQPFGHDDDGFGAGMDMMGGHGGEGMDHSADMAMAGMAGVDMAREREGDAAATQPAAAAPLPLAADAAADGELLKRSRSPPAASGHAPQHYDPSQTSATTFLSSAIDGTIRIWDRRVAGPVARIGTRAGVPPWCMSACWSPDGNMIYAGRRNGTVEEFDVRRATRAWQPERTLRFPAGSGAVSALRPMVNGRHLVCASHDILRLYDLRDSRAFRHSTVPFLIIPGPPRAGVISSLYVDPTSRFMLSAAGTRGWEGTCTEVLIGYEINVVA